MLFLIHKFCNKRKISAIRLELKIKAGFNLVREFTKYVAQFEESTHNLLINSIKSSKENITKIHSNGILAETVHKFLFLMK